MVDMGAVKDRFLGLVLSLAIQGVWTFCLWSRIEYFFLS